MDLLDIFIYMAVLLMVILFFPDFFPRCACCKNLKLRPLFKIHKTVRLTLGYSAYKSVCRKCCMKYGIASLRDLDQVKSIKRKVEADLNANLVISESQYKSAARKKI